MIGAALTFLAQHADLLELLYSAITGGMSKDKLTTLIKDAMVAEADAQMKLQLGGKS